MPRAQNKVKYLHLYRDGAKNVILHNKRIYIL